MDDATAYLTPPEPPDNSITNGFVSPLDFFNYTSPSAWINTAIEKLTGVDLIGWVTECLAGDWEALWKFGDAMGNLARSLQQLGINIEQGMLTLDASWDGNTNDAAYKYFSDLSAAISSQQIPLYNSEDSYHMAAKGAWLLADQLGNLVQAIADEAILATIAAAAGTATAETVVGAIGGYAITGIYVLRMLDKINEASKIINTAGTATLGAFGMVADATAQVGHLSSVPLPANGFALPTSRS